MRTPSGFLATMSCIVSVVLFSVCPRQAAGGEPKPSGETRAGNAHAAALPPLLLHVRLKLAQAAALRPADVKFAVFPSGKLCAFYYVGVSNPKTVAALGQMGFRTTIYRSQSASAEEIKALQAAGAEIAVENLWGRGMGLSSVIGGRTHQEAFDMAATGRLFMQKLTGTPAAIAPVANLKAGLGFLMNRNIESANFGYVFQDCNYLANTGLADRWAILLSRPGELQQTFLSMFRNSPGGYKTVPNEIIYYQIIASWFEGTLGRLDKGQIVQIALRDFQANDMKQLLDRIGKYGKHPRIWHATEGQVISYEYLAKQCHVTAVEAGPKELELTLALARNLYPPFLQAPLCLKLPRGLSVESATIGNLACPCTVVPENRPEDEELDDDDRDTTEDAGVYVDVPVAEALRDGAAMSLSSARVDMTIPDEMPLDLTIRNTADKPLEDAKLDWSTNDPAVGVSDKQEGPFTLAAGAERKVQVRVAATRGARFGMAVVNAVLTARVGQETQSFMAGAEVVLAPRLRVDMDPAQQFPMVKGSTQHLLVHVSNERASKPGGPPDMFISQSTGAVKATATVQVPEGMDVTPKEIPFELPAEGGRKTLVFKVHNDRWGKELVRVRPLFTFQGEKEPIEHVYPGTNVIRDEEVLDFKPLDDRGLTFYGGFEKNENRASSPRNITGWGNRSYYHEGVKGWCLDTGSCTFLDPFKTVDCRQGTATIWIRRDPQHKNENQYRPDPTETWKHPLEEGYGYAELIMGDEGAQTMETSKSGAGLRRWPGWEGKRGYLEATFRAMGKRKYYCQAPFDWTDQWHHLALLWHAADRRLEIYIDGKLAANADPGDEEWHISPWDRGRPGGGTNGGWSLGSCDHGKKFYTLRDEVYIYNRALSAEEIRANMELTRK